MRRLIITLALISCTIGVKAQAPDAVDHVESDRLPIPNAASTSTKTCSI